jgi:hypothetical protein
MEDKKKPTHEVAQISDETLQKLASRDEDIRQSGVIDIFEQHLPQIPKDYVFKPKDRTFVEDSMHAAFDMFGGVRRLSLWAHENPTEFIKLWARLLPEAQKNESGPAIVQVFHNVPPSALDIGDYVDADDLDDE